MANPNYIGNMRWDVYYPRTLKEAFKEDFRVGISFSNTTYESALGFEEYQKRCEEARRAEEIALRSIQKQFPIDSFIIDKTIPHIGRLKVVGHSEFGVLAQSEAGLGKIYVTPRHAQAVPDYNLEELL